MHEAMIKGETLNAFQRLVSGFIHSSTEYEFVCLHESATNSEHVHRVSVFICDKDHNHKNTRFLDELKRYLDAHFPEDEAPEPLTGGKPSHLSKRNHSSQYSQ